MININFKLSAYSLLCLMLFPRIWCRGRIHPTRVFWNFPTGSMNRAPAHYTLNAVRSALGLFTNDYKTTKLSFFIFFIFFGFCLASEGVPPVYSLITWNPGFFFGSQHFLRFFVKLFLY